MRSLLTITALVEGATGLALAFIPSLLVPILLGTSLTDPAGILFGRLAGAALTTLAIACWLSRLHNASFLVVKTMVVYNIFSIALLVYAALVEKISGPGLWPAVVVHVALLIWCLSSLHKHAEKNI